MNNPKIAADKKPTADVKVIYDGLLKLAEKKIQALNSSNSPSSGVRAWLGTVAIDRTDIQDSSLIRTAAQTAQVQDDFWGTAIQYNDDNDDNVALELALWLVNQPGNGPKYGNSAVTDGPVAKAIDDISNEVNTNNSINSLATFNAYAESVKAKAKAYPGTNSLANYNAVKAAVDNLKTAVSNASPNNNAQVIAAVTAGSAAAKTVGQDMEQTAEYFEILIEPKNLDFFKKMVKVALNKYNEETLYGLNRSIDADGNVILNFGSSKKIVEAVKSLSDVNDSLINRLEINKILIESGSTSGQITTYDQLVKVFSKVGSSNFVNLSKIPTTKGGNDLVAASNQYFSRPSNGPTITTEAYNGYTAGSDESIALNNKLLFVSTLIDIAAEDASQRLNSNQSQHVNSILSSFNPETYQQWLELHATYVDATATEINKGYFNTVFSSLIQYRFYGNIGKYGKTEYWRNAIVDALKELFGDETLEEAVDINNNSLESPFLTLNRASSLINISELIKYQLHLKVPFVDASTGESEEPDTLSNYVRDITDDALGSPYAYQENLTRSIVLGLVVAVKQGNYYSIHQDGYNELVSSGISQTNIGNMVLPSQVIKGRILGGITFYTFVPRDESGNLAFDN